MSTTTTATTASTTAATTASTTTEVATSAWSVTITATTAIDAPAATVWDILTATDAYPDWNPFVRSLRGPLVVGQRVEVELQLPGHKLRTMRPRVTAVDEGRSFEWLGRVGVPGLFDGRHRFEVIADGPDRCTLVQHEHLSGPLVPFARSLLTGATPDGFAGLNDALKVRAEERQTHGAR